MKKTQIAAFSYDGSDVSFEITDMQEARKAVGADEAEEKHLETVVQEDIELTLLSYSLADVMTRIITNYGYDISKVKKHIFGGILRMTVGMLESMDAPDDAIDELDHLAERELEDIITLYGDPDDMCISASCEKLIDSSKINSSDRSVEMAKATVRTLANAIATVTQREIGMGMSEEEVLTEAIMSVPEALNRQMDGVEIGTFFGVQEKEFFDRAMDDEGRPGFIS